MKVSSKQSINKRNQKLKKTWKKKASYKMKTSSYVPTTNRVFGIPWSRREQR
jgi:hypothetical protein